MRTCHFVGFVVLRLIYKRKHRENQTHYGCPSAVHVMINNYLLDKFSSNDYMQKQHTRAIALC